MDTVFEYVDHVLSTKIPQQITFRGLPSAFIDGDVSYASVYRHALRFETEMPRTARLIRGHIVKILRPVQGQDGYDDSCNAYEGESRVGVY